MVSKPRQLFKVLEKKGFGIDRRFPGVYYVTGIICMPLQIVIGSELEGEEFLAFRILKKRAKKEDIRRFVLAFRRLKGRWKKTLTEFGHSILSVSAAKNREIFEQLRKEDVNMRSVLREIMNDEISEELQKERDDTSEEIAKKMIKKNKPASEISEFTSVSSTRLMQLADALGVSLVRG